MKVKANIHRRDFIKNTGMAGLGLYLGGLTIFLPKFTDASVIPQIIGKKMTKNPFPQMFPTGEANTAYAQYFTGQSYLATLANGDCSAHNVTFEPGCRNHWHIHHGQRQLLICTAGKGWYQVWGEPAQMMLPGDVIDVPAEVKHWHGAAKDSWFSHIAIMMPKEGASAEWCEPVSDEQYAAVDK